MQIDTDGMSAKSTDRAKAEAAKWKRLDEIFAQRKIIPSRLLASRGGNPPRLVYGWACTREYFSHYATHHNLTYDVPGDIWLQEQVGTTLIKPHPCEGTYGASSLSSLRSNVSQPIRPIRSFLVSLSRPNARSR
ncbi:hypothetical protein L226DRAFT_304393 [Lentinus tigrinus ALCF2SS1-7]|nr:hypothetical protein L226DRAFT_304393 [Lentinus tigrinus ALCF2SS1-7]